MQLHECLAELMAVMDITIYLFLLLVCVLAVLLLAVLDWGPKAPRRNADSSRSAVLDSVEVPVSHLKSQVERFARVVDTL